MSATFDLLLTGGTVLDLASGRRGRMDVGIRTGQIAAMQAALPRESGAQILDVSGCYITPGLIDFHLHSYWGVNPYSVDADERCLQTGVTTAVDAGSAGPVNFGGFRRLVAEQTMTRMLAFVCVAQHGVLRSPGELVDLAFADPEGAADVVHANRDVAVGIKVRLQEASVGQNGREALRLALQAGEACHAPVMVHIGLSTISMEEIADSLRPGDIITHCFTPLQPAIVDEQGRLRAAVARARERGVLFDVGHGGRHMDFGLVLSAMRDGLLPDILSTDLHTAITSNSMDMPQVMTKFLALGMRFEQVVAASTGQPAQAIGWQDRMGSLDVGREADISILELREEPVTVRDAVGVELPGSSRVVARYTIRAGKLLKTAASSSK